MALARALGAGTREMIAGRRDNYVGRTGIRISRIFFLKLGPNKFLQRQITLLPLVKSIALRPVKISHKAPRVLPHVHTAVSSNQRGAPSGSQRRVRDGVSDVFKPR